MTDACQLMKTMEACISPQQIFLGFQNKRYPLSQNTSAESQQTDNPAERSSECVNSNIMLNTYAKVSIGVYITASDCNPLSGVDDIHANCSPARPLCSVWNISMAQFSI